MDGIPVATAPGLGPSLVRMLLRPATLDDAAAIADIYNVEVLESTVTFDIEPRSLAEQEAWLHDRTGAHVVLVAEIDGEVAGLSLIHI